MKNILEKAYARQREQSWRKRAQAVDDVAWAAAYFIVLAALALAWAWGA